jgi:hypothetical protein
VIKMSVFQDAQRAAARLRQVRELRDHCQSGGSVTCQWDKGYQRGMFSSGVVLTEASRDLFLQVLDAEEQALLAGIKGYGVDLDEGAA